MACAGDSVAGGIGVVGVEFDAEPVAAVAFGDDRGGSRAHERVEHEPRPPPRAARACGNEVADDRGTAGAIGRSAFPWLAACDADALRAGGEDRSFDEQLLGAIEWVLPDRSLGVEIERVLDAGNLSGADCWHLAMALFAAPDPHHATFLTLDVRQRAVAKALGFRV